MPIRRLSWAAVLLLIALLRAAEPDDTLALGRKALEHEGVATAWKLAQKAVADAPGSAAAHEFSGEVLFRRGEFAQAEAEFQSAAKLDPKFALAWWGLARVSECESQNKTAAENFQRAYTLDPTDARIVRDWAVRLPTQQQADALEQYASVASRNRVGVDLQDLQERMQFARVVRGRAFTVLASPYERAAIPFALLVNDKTHMRSYGLAVRVNSSVLNLILDTGASGIVIPRRIAEKAGVSPLSQTTLRGFGDASRPSGGYRGVAQHIQIGAVEYRDALISVADQEAVGTADGLIGANVFSEFLVTLDFPARTLRLNPIPGYQPRDNTLQDRGIPPGFEHAARIFRFAHLLLLPTRVNGSREGLFVIDTGADRTLISYDLANEVTKLDQDRRMHVSGINGQVPDLYRTGDLVLQFAGFEQKNLGMSSIDTFDQSRRVGTEISGFLGLPVLDLFALTIDYRDGLVNFERK